MIGVARSRRAVRAIRPGLRRGRVSAVSLGLGLTVAVSVCGGCATAKQSVAEVNAGLASFVSPDRAEGWPLATQVGVPFDRAPAVVVAWSPTATNGGVPPAPPTRAARERWIAAIREKLERSGKVTRAEGSSAEAFDDGITLEGVQRLAADHGADLIVLFGLETVTRRYHALEPHGAPGPPASDVASVVEVLALSKMVGMTSSGIPLFADNQKGFAAADSRTRSVDELETTSQRVAVDLLGDAIVRRLIRISP